MPSVAEARLVPGWSSAACRMEDPELFFPIGNTGPFIQQIEEAKAVCRRCPVVEACRAAALERDEEFGVWGGLSEADRHALKRQERSSARMSEVAA